MAIVKTKRTLADLSAAHDRKVMVPNRIREALKILVDSENDWVYEADFVKLLTPPIGAADCSRYRAQFDGFWADAPSVNGKASARKVWFANKALCAKWKASLSEQ